MSYKGIDFIFFVIITTLIMVITSCSEPSSKTKLICNEGELQNCSCNSGALGKQICQNNKWQNCFCKVNIKCKNITCSNNGYCKVNHDEAGCICNTGYHAEGLNCIKDGELDPCKEKTCPKHSVCSVESDQAVCNCEFNYILNEKLCIFDCSNLTNSHVNSDNTACACNQGYHLNETEDICIENDDFKCLNYECSDNNSHCIVENNQAKCICNNNYKLENNICILDCSLIENSHHNDTNDSCICNNGYHLENNLCVSNQKTVNCMDITPPANAHQLNVEITISWSEENGWDTIENCDWQCNDGYQDHDSNNTCEIACNEASCLHGSCDDSSGKLDCTCDNGYQDNNNDEICLPNCESTMVDGVECGGHGICHDDTGEVICICDDKYQDNDGNGICKKGCHIDLLAPELSTCGKNGTCSDLTGEIVCSCDDGYFINPNNGKCIEPCENINCGNHGECVAINLNTMACACDNGYQDNDNDLICKKSCTSSCLSNSISCNDSNGILSCECEQNYQDNDQNGTCLPNCSTNNCNLDKQIQNSCNDISGFSVCQYVVGYNYTNLISGLNDQIINDSVVDSNGNLYLVGSFKGTVDFDPTDGIDEKTSSGNEDIFITRINADNSYGWTYHIGSYSEDSATNIAVDEYDNLYVGGYFSSTVDFDNSNLNVLLRSNAYRDIFLLKITRNGEFNWAKSIMSDDSASVSSIKLDDNAIYLTGSLLGDNNNTINVDFDNTSNSGNFVVKGREDGFISKFNISDGSYIWAKTFGSNGWYNKAKDIIILSDSIVITGGISGDVDFDLSDETKGLLSTNNKFETFILKLSKDNQFIWAKKLDSQDNSDLSRGLKLESINNNLYLLGFLRGNIDFDTSENQDIVNAGENQSIYIAKINDDGSVASKEIFLSTNGDSIITDSFISNGNLYITGNIGGNLNIQSNIISNSSSEQNSNDVFWFRLDSNLNAYNINHFGGVLDDSSSSISVYNNSVYVSGTFFGTTDFDPTEQIDSKTSKGMKDIFISRYSE